MVHFLQIIINEKIVGDYRAFLHARVTSNNNKDGPDRIWELRGYGKTAGESADDVYKKYLSPVEDWELHGYTI